MTDQTVALLQLVKRKDSDSSDIDMVDFLALPTELQYQGWNQGLPQPNMPSVDESITLLLNSGNANTLASALQSIDAKIKEIGWAQDPINPIGVWLRAQLVGETNPRQCFILAAKRPPKGLEITNPLAYGGVVPNYNLGLTRMPKWENPLVTLWPAALGAISIHGGKIAYTNSGDAHARVEQAFFYGYRNHNPTLSDVWIGVKSNRYGVDPTKFVPIWNFGSDGFVVDTDDTSFVAAGGNGGALNGTEVLITFATHTNLITRVGATVSGIVAGAGLSVGDRENQRGKYTALLRVRPSDPSLVCNVRIGQGFLFEGTTLTSLAFKPRVQIPAPTVYGWQYFALGQITLPAIANFTTAVIQNTCLVIDAEKVSGTGNLEIDNLLLIPAEHTVHVHSVNGAVGGTINLYIHTRPDGRVSAFSYGDFSGLADEAMSPDAMDWAIPSGSVEIIFGGSNAGTVVDDTFSPQLRIYPSYNSLRGSA